MSYYLHFMAATLLSCLSLNLAQSQETKEPKPNRVLTPLGTIKGEVSKVTDGGRKIEVKYKELVTTSRSSSGTSTRGSSTSGKVRLPVPKELVLKEKNQELELRLIESSIVRLLDKNDQAGESKAPAKKKTTSADENKGEASESDKKENKTDEEKPAKKGNSKTNKKSGEPALPGKAGDPSSIIKGQVVIVTVAREDLPGFSRLIATSVYILGEK